MNNHNHYHDDYHYQNQNCECTSENNNEQFDDIIIRRSNETIIARANVDLYNAKFGAKNWNLIDGGMIYLMQNQNVYYLILFDTENLQPIWQREVSRNIVYKVDKPYFHIVFIKDELYGVNFTDLTEAEMFFYAMQRLYPFRNFSKLISKFTARVANFFTRKRTAPPQIYDNNQRYQRVDMKRTNYLNDNQFYRDKIPTKDTNHGRMTGNRHHVRYNDDYWQKKFKPTCVPKPPPLPPPVQNFQFTLMKNNRLPIGKNYNRYPNSFKAQIKHEALKRLSGGNNLFKYLP